MFCRALCPFCEICDSVLFLSATVDKLLDKIRSVSLIMKNSQLFTQTFSYKCSIQQLDCSPSTAIA